MGLPTPVPGMAEDTEEKWVGWTPRVKASLNFVLWASLPSAKCWLWHLLQRVVCKSRLGPGGRGKLSKHLGVHV